MALFRKEALDAYANVEQRGELLHIRPPSGLALVLLVALTLAGVTALAATATIELRVVGRGNVTAPGGAIVVRSPAAGVLVSVGTEGDEVAAGDVVATVDTAGGVVELTAICGGLIDLVDAHPGEQLSPGGPVAHLSPREDLIGYMTVSSTERTKLQSGQRARLRIDGYAGERWADAKVRRVSETQLSPEHLRHLFGLTQPPPLPLHLVELELTSMPDRKQSFQSGMAFTAEIPVGTQSVLSMLLPI